MYREIQQRMIDVLDEGDYVKVIGKGKNKTNMTVQLTKRKNPLKETLFEKLSGRCKYSSGRSVHLTPA